MFRSKNRPIWYWCKAVTCMYGCLCIISCFECLFCWLMVMVASVCNVGCVYMATPTGRGGGSLFWQRVPLSRLALPVNRDVQYNAVILDSAVISIIMHCTSRLTGHARHDNGTHCQDNALPPPRRVGVAVYYFCIFSEKQKKKFRQQSCRNFYPWFRKNNGNFLHIP